MRELKKIKIRHSGRIADAFLLGIYTREHVKLRKTLSECLLFRKTKSKITTAKRKTYLVFIPWKHSMKELDEVTESDVIPFDNTIPAEWISVSQYTSIGSEDYHPSAVIRDFHGYPFVFRNNSFIADQISGEYETNLEILYSELPELLNEAFDEDIG